LRPSTPARYVSYFTAQATHRGLTVFFPETYQAALLLMILTMLCRGSWAGTPKRRISFNNFTEERQA
jgi:hypothetical protein